LPSLFPRYERRLLTRHLTDILPLSRKVVLQFPYYAFFAFFNPADL